MNRSLKEVLQEEKLTGLKLTSLKKQVVECETELRDLGFEAVRLSIQEYDKSSK